MPNKKLDMQRAFAKAAALEAMEDDAEVAPTNLFFEFFVAFFVVAAFMAVKQIQEHGFPKSFDDLKRMLGGPPRMKRQISSPHAGPKRSYSPHRQFSPPPAGRAPAYTPSPLNTNKVPSASLVSSSGKSAGLGLVLPKSDSQQKFVLSPDNTPLTGGKSPPVLSLSGAAPFTSPVVTPRRQKMPVSPKASPPCTDPARVRDPVGRMKLDDPDKSKSPRRTERRRSSCPSLDSSRAGIVSLIGFRAAATVAEKPGQTMIVSGREQVPPKARSESPRPTYGFRRPEVKPAASFASSKKGLDDPGRQIAHAFFTTTDPQVAIGLVQMWAEQKKVISAEAIATFMHRCAKVGIACPEDLLSYFAQQIAAVPDLSTILDYSPRAPPKATISNRAVSAICYGLQHSHDCPELRELQKALAKVISESRDLHFDDQAIWNSLFGMQRAADCEESRALLGALAKKIWDSDVSLNCQKIGHAFFGLQRFDDSPEMRLMLKSLRKQIFHCPAPLEAGAVGHAMHGLKGCSDSQEYRLVLAAFAGKIKQSPDMVMTAQAAAHSLFGVRKAVDCTELRSFIGAMVSPVKKCTEPLDGMLISQALHGMRGCGHDHPSTREMLSVLKEKLETSAARFGAAGVALALGGLQGCGACKEAKPIIRILTERISKATCKLDGRQFSNAMKGFEKMQPQDPLTCRLLEAVAPRLDKEIHMDVKDLASCFKVLSRFAEVNQALPLLCFIAEKSAVCERKQNANEVAEWALALEGLKQGPVILAMTAVYAVKLAESEGQLSDDMARKLKVAISGFAPGDEVEAMKRAITAKRSRASAA